MKTFISAVAPLLLCVSTFAQVPVISSFDQNGRLLCTNLPPNSPCAVEWANALAGPWLDNWTPLNPVLSDSNGVVEVLVPRFYRVRTTLINTNPPAINTNPPVAMDDVIALNEDTSTSFSTSTFLQNDFDPDYDPLSIVAVDNAVNGTVSLQNPTIIFTPSFNFSGDATFRYTVSDGNGYWDTADVIVHVLPVNDAPVLDNTKSPLLDDVSEDAPAPVGMVGTAVASLVDFASSAGDGAIDNITDPDEPCPRGIALVGAETANGSWWYSLNSGTTWTKQAGTPLSDSNCRLLAADNDTRLYFQPSANFFGSARITFRAWDRSSGVNGNLVNISVFSGSSPYSAATDTATVSVMPQNDRPDARDDLAATGINTPLVQSTTAFIANDVDADGDPLTITAVGELVNGTVLLEGTTITFTPAPGFSGVASFQYTLSDGELTDTATVTVIVN